MIKSYVLRALQNVTAKQRTAMDTNRDGNINALDYLLVKNAVLSHKNEI